MCLLVTASATFQWLYSPRNGSKSSLFQGSDSPFIFRNKNQIMVFQLKIYSICPQFGTLEPRFSVYVIINIHNTTYSGKYNIFRQDHSQQQLTMLRVYSFMCKLGIVTSYIPGTIFISSNELCKVLFIQDRHLQVYAFKIIFHHTLTHNVCTCSLILKLV